MTDQHASQQRPKNSPDQDDRRSFTIDVKRRLTNPAWVARAAGVSLSTVSLGFVAIFIVVLESGGNLTIFTQPLPMQVALTLPSLVLLLTCVTTAGAVLSWWHRYWSLPKRIQQSVLSLLGVAFSWQLWRLGFLPW